ncbi:MAG TPA: hypothetical protein VNO82_06315, partial [Solirubrobacteraceae bacterium]|nr:hypothetical protein [Solirubrobacteraceae bacterium]
MRFLKTGLPLLVLAALAAPASAGAKDHDAVGSAGLGDRLFPTLGNGGYDARHYDLGLDYGDDEVRGVVRMRATATQSLKRFNLDYAGDDVHGVWVDGRKAAFRREGRELVITPERSLRSRRSFDVVVAFSGGPYTPAADDPFPIGWFTTRDGSVTSGQPDRAQDVYPVNDHPSDKATYR